LPVSKPPAEREAALISVYDRTGVVELARALEARSVPIYASSGTWKFLTEHGIDAHELAELTGFPSLFDGRVKTLHPRVFGGILADRRSEVHERERSEHGIPRIGIVVVNLYPFEATIAGGHATIEEAIEQIDIGGVALIRAAAKNFEHVTVLIEPSQYREVIAAHAESRGEISPRVRRALATRAFERTAEYDAAIARYFGSGVLARDLPGSLALTSPISAVLRYGENPQSRAAFYLPREHALPEQLGGKALSYNNLLDLDAALRLLVPARVPSVVDPSADGHARRARPEPVLTAEREPLVRAAIVKHTIPCGVAERATAAEAARLALEADRISAFGGIVALDGTVDVATAEVLAPVFLEIVAAPAFDDDALARLRKKKDLRIIRFDGALPGELARELRVRSALGGVLAEDDDPKASPECWRIASQRQPGEREWHDLRFAWDVVRHVKSNGVVIARERVTRGICAGQTNRVDAVRIAAARAADFARGAACASDGFFPFPDGLLAAVDAGCAAVIAPQGSIRDAEVVAAADARGIALVFSTYRYFLH